MELSEFAKVAVDATKKAEEIILNHFKPDIKIDLKPDSSFVSVADKEAEEVIIKTLKDAFPDHGILGEESGKNISGSEYVWVIDPIDATKNYIRQIQMFSTELVLMKNNQLVLGISNAPLLNEFLIAERGKGAYLNGKRIHVSKTASLKDSFMCFSGLNHFQTENYFDGFMNLVDSFGAHRGLGDFYGHHLVARGAVELMIEAKIKFWDIAALNIIIEEAGGRMTDFKGNKITEETSVVVSSNGIIHDKVLELLNKKS